jgi:uncharacterized protein
MSAIRILSLFWLLSILAWADLEAGKQALANGDYAAALKEFLPLAGQGNVDAQVSLGLMYEKGKGVPQDHKEAVRWYRLAAQQSDSQAQFNLGRSYDEGDGVLRDYKEAVRWYPGCGARGTRGADQSRRYVAERLCLPRT